MANKWRVCPMCQGEGLTVNRAVSVWTESDRDADPDGFLDMLAGKYDVTCYRCRGRRVVSQETDDEYEESEQDRRTQLMESGIYPGSPDWD